MPVKLSVKKPRGGLHEEAAKHMGEDQASFWRKGILPLQLIQAKAQSLFELASCPN